jgi:hypothetical protein
MQYSYIYKEIENKVTFLFSLPCLKFTFVVTCPRCPSFFYSVFSGCGSLKKTVGNWEMASVALDDVCVNYPGGVGFAGSFTTETVQRCDGRKLQEPGLC